MPFFNFFAKGFGSQELVYHSGNQPLVNDEAHDVIRKYIAGNPQVGRLMTTSERN
jgi:hypothetical protein